MLRVGFQAGMDDAFDCLVSFEPARDLERALRNARACAGAGSEAAHRQGRNRTVRQRHRPSSAGRPSARPVPVLAGHDDAADHVRMAVGVFRRRMQDEVCAMPSGRCGIGEQKVLSTTRSNRACGKGADLREIDQLQHRVGRRLRPDHPGVFGFSAAFNAAVSLRSMKLKSSPAE